MQKEGNKLSRSKTEETVTKIVDLLRKSGLTIEESEKVSNELAAAIQYIKQNNKI